MKKWKYQLDKNAFETDVLMDLPKVFDTINYHVFLAKIYAYGFGKNVLGLVYSYLKIRKQRVNINTTFTTWANLISSVP